MIIKIKKLTIPTLKVHQEFLSKKTLNANVIKKYLMKNVQMNKKILVATKFIMKEKIQKMKNILDL